MSRPKAALLAVKLPDEENTEFEASLAELARLVTTLGYEVSATLTQHRAQYTPATLIGSGKLQELVELTGYGENEGELEERRPGEHIELVAVDHDLTPTQLRNLEKACGAQVLDRTGVIIEIFHRHAKSKKAKIEVELARLAYEAPRLRESPRGKEKQQGRGAGEAQLELDRRKIRDRMAELREELELLQREDRVRRAQRHDARRVALVGYTNAGKSSWMRALTGSQVLVEDKLFATLDTTVRALHPEVTPRILVSDTVGFIKKLPHDLVASFQSTLDEALEASLLLLVADATDPGFREQLAVTQQVLGEIGATHVPSRLLLNKIDRLAETQLTELAHEFPDAWLASARRPPDVARIHGQIVDFFAADNIEGELFVPYDRQRLIAELHQVGHVLQVDYQDAGVRVRVRADPQTLDRIRDLCAAAQSD
ncbi:MAG TPA: GTPase HflX [Polyangiaceae bacterium]|nr:GTPase HflX [Polyangiaceae bacterium]